MTVEQAANDMLDQCDLDGQAACTVDGLDRLRAALLAQARERRLHIRTALIDDVVVVARTDAKLWTDDTATMRRKLTPK